jgi:hypothetical protein
MQPFGLLYDRAANHMSLFRNLFTQEESEGAGREPAQSSPQPKASTGGHLEIFYLGDLLAFIPPAIAAPGNVPLDQTIQIPLPNSESRDVKLSTIYQICPALFAVEITPLNDSTVSLPPSHTEPLRMNGNSNPDAFKGNPFGDASEENQNPHGQETKPHSSPEQAPPSSGFGFGSASQAASSFPDAAPQPSSPWKQQEPTNSFGQVNPFQSGAPDDGVEPSNPFADAGFHGGKPAPPEGGPESHPSHSPQQPQSPVDQPAPGTQPEAEKFSTIFGRSPEEKNQPSPEQTFHEARPESDKPDPSGQSFGSLFKEATGEYVGPPPESNDYPFSDLNYDQGSFETFIPPGMQDSEPAPHAPPNGEEHPTHPAPGDFSLPTSGHFGQASPFMGGADHPQDVPSQNQMFSGIPAQQESEKESLSARPSQPETSQPHPEPREEPREPRPRVEVKVNSQKPTLNQPPKSSPDREERPAPPESQQPAPAMAWGQPTRPPAADTPLQPNDFPQNESHPVPEKNTIPQASGPQFEEREVHVPTTGMTAQPSRAGSGGGTSFPEPDQGFNWSHIALRAIFHSDEEFTFKRVSEKIAQINGILSCAVVTNHGVFETCSDPHFAIGEKIKHMGEHVRGMAAISGNGSAPFFTVQMGEGVISFFFGDQHFIGIKHYPDAFAPGVREKLILAAHSLDDLQP